MGWSVNQQRGLTHSQPTRCVPGYTLVAPLFASNAYLLDMAGRVVHKWSFGGQGAFLARLLPNGRLITLGPDTTLPPLPAGNADHLPFHDRARALGGNGALLREYDWDGSILWEYRNPAMHHDFVRLANGHTLLPEWVELADAFARSVRGGWKLPGGNNLVCEGATGRLFEVTTRGEVVWEWLSPFFNVNPRLGQSLPWTYRAYRYLPDDPALEGRALDPGHWGSLNRLYGLYRD